MTANPDNHNQDNPASDELAGTGRSADARWMRLALAEAARSRGAVEPNPMVGAVITRDGRLIAAGRHRRFGGPHAEVDALRRAGPAARGATLHVTLEPCRHHGKTPPCVGAILEAGIARVVAAMRDPFPRVAGGGFAELRAAGVAVTVGVEEAAARELNAAYLKRVLTGMPYVHAKWATTLDGRIAARTGDSRWISNARSRVRVHEERGRMDAVIVGVGTAIADDPRLTARPPGPRTPARIVLDPRGRLPLGSILVRTARETPTIAVVDANRVPTSAAALAAAGVETLPVPSDPDGRARWPDLLRILGGRGFTNVLIEGGGRTLGTALDAGVIDAVDVYVAPRLVGGEPIHAPMIGRGFDTIAAGPRLVRADIEILDGDIRIRGRFPHAWLGETEAEPDGGASGALDR